jgi:hypothetical protein
VLGGKYVGGVVTNWTLVTLHHDTQSCMDPNVIEAQVVVSSCGHDGPMGAHSVKRLSKLGMVPDVPGMAALDMNSVSICDTLPFSRWTEHGASLSANALPHTFCHTICLSNVELPANIRQPLRVA